MAQIINPINPHKLHKPTISRQFLHPSPVFSCYLRNRFSHTLKKQTGQGRFKSGLLALIFIAEWALKLGLTLFFHHAHHDAPVCVAAHECIVAHVHDARYLPDDCSMCAFLFAIPELITVAVWLEPTPAVTERITQAYLTPLLSPGGDSVNSRGPPRG